VIQPINLALTQFFDERFEGIDQLVFVEQNYSGQFEKQIKVECGLMTPDRDAKISNIRKYSNYPFFGEEIV
jgi:hypothetical protein